MFIYYKHTDLQLLEICVVFNYMMITKIITYGY